VSDRFTNAPSQDAPASLHRQLEDEVATRLRRVCRDMPPERFEALVREIVRVKVKYDPPPVPLLLSGLAAHLP
jgi:hypothetical protein